MKTMRLPRWFPQINVIIEMRPVFWVHTSVAYEALEMDTIEILSLAVGIFNWKWMFRLYKKAA